MICQGKELCVTMVTVTILWTLVEGRGSPPRITEPQGNTWHYRKEYIRGTKVIECRASGEPEPKYRWTLNGTDIRRASNLARYVVYDEISGNLTVNLTRKASGEFQCTAFNKYGSAMTPFLRLIASEAWAFPGPEKGTIQVLDTYLSKYSLLDCINVPVSVPPWDFEWKRNKKFPDKDSWETIPKTEMGRRMVIDTKGRLHILWVQESDGNYNYACVGKNKVLLIDIKNTDSVKLRVEKGQQNDRGPVLVFSEDVVVEAGEPAKLMCIFTYFSRSGEEMKIRWIFQGKVIGEGHTLVLPNVAMPTEEMSQEGEYSCEARVGQKYAHGKVNLKITSPPVFIPNQELTSTSAPVGNDVTFTCSTTSHKTYNDPPVWLVNAELIIGCEPWQFECDTSIPGTARPQCISRDLVCNAAPDCTDGSDERSCPGPCNEGQLSCLNVCVPEGVTCPEHRCQYPHFSCRDGSACLDKSLYCDGRMDCMDNSDEEGCPNRKDIRIGKFIISSDRRTLTVASVGLDDVMCVQCMVSNAYGTIFGNGCLTVIYKIDVTRRPKKVYDVTPGLTLSIFVDANTDDQWSNQMLYDWVWLNEVTDPHTGEKKTVETSLLSSNYSEYFQVLNASQNLTIYLPEVIADDEKSYEAFQEMTHRKYAAVVSHHFDKVLLPFTLKSIGAIPPGPQSARALWLPMNFLHVIIVLAAATVMLAGSMILCYMYKNRGGYYYLDKKEIKAGHNPEQELANSGLIEASRIYDNFVDEEMSSSDTLQSPDSDKEYGGNFEGSKFGEDGSFIGLYYGNKHKLFRQATV